MWQKTASTIGGSKGFYTGSELGQDVVCLSQYRIALPTSHSTEVDLFQRTTVSG